MRAFLPILLAIITLQIKAEEGTDINIGGVLAIIGNVDTAKKISEENNEKKNDFRATE